MEKIDVRKAAVTLGLVFAIWHLGWALTVALGGGGYVSWISELHFVSMAHSVLPLDLAMLAIGVAGAFLCGAATGAIFAYIWNMQSAGKKAK